MSLKELNWRELERWVGSLRPRLVGHRIRALGTLPHGVYTVSLESALVAFTLKDGISALWITRNAPDWTMRLLRDADPLWLRRLGSHLHQAKVVALEAVLRERIVIWTVESPQGDRERLVFVLTARRPHAVLIDAQDRVILSSDPKISEGEPWITPQGVGAPDAPALRPPLDRLKPGEPADLDAELEEAVIDEMDLLLRGGIAEGDTRERVEAVLKRLETTLSATEVSGREEQRAQTAQADAVRLRHWGMILKTIPGAASDEARTLQIQDPETGVRVAVPVEEDHSPSEQSDHYFLEAKRLERSARAIKSRIESAREARRVAAEILGRFRREWVLRQSQRAKLDLEEWLRGWEERVGQKPAQSDSRAVREKFKKSVQRSRRGWKGKVYELDSNWQVWIGKSRIENHALVTRHSKGGDLWLHVRGRPGAHGLIPMGRKTSDLLPHSILQKAAWLVIVASNGRRWGSTEVIVTECRNLKPVKGKPGEFYYRDERSIVVDGSPDARDAEDLDESER